MLLSRYDLLSLHYFRDDDRVKHFLIDASEEQCYHFFGNDQIRHESLDELILYHQVKFPLTEFYRHNS